MVYIYIYIYQLYISADSFFSKFVLSGVGLHNSITRILALLQCYLQKIIISVIVISSQVYFR